MPLGTPPFLAHFDGNSVPTLTGVVGTLGTSDQPGTAQPLPIGVNPSTGAAYVQNLGTQIGGTNVNLNSGTLNNGTVAITAGTITPATGFEGGTVAVGTAAVEITFTGATKAIQVTADHDNTAAVYVGPSAVAVTGSAAIDRLGPGEALYMELNDASAAVYAIGGTTGQKVYKLGLT